MLAVRKVSVLEKVSIFNKSLRYKLMIAFSLMAVIPILSCVYLISSFLVPGFSDLTSFSIVIIVSLVISILGYVIAISIVNSAIDIAREARKIAGGEYDRKIDLIDQDELGVISQSINFLTKIIRSNLNEIKNYGQSVKSMRSDMQKKVNALSGLLQLDDIISSGSIQIEPLLELAVTKAASISDTGYGVLYLPRGEGGDLISKFCFNIVNEDLLDIVIKKEGRGVLEKVLETKKMVQVEEGMKLSKDLDDFRIAHGLTNFVAMALHSNKAIFGLLILGNRLSAFNYTKDDIELMSVFAKHITIAIERSVLEKKNRELSITDELTELFNKRYLLMRLDEEIKRAIFYQRPCAFIIFMIANYAKFREVNGDAASDEALKRVAKVIRDNNLPIGRAGRIGADEFAVLLPEKNKREATDIANELCGKIENANMLKDGKKAFVVKVGVSENPIDGITSDELLAKALASM